MGIRTRLRTVRSTIRNTPVDTKTNVSNFILTAMVGIFTVVSTCNNNKTSDETLRLTKSTDSLNGVIAGLSATQVGVLQQMKNTNLDIQHFNSLLVKTDTNIEKQSQLVSLASTQIDSLVALNRVLTKEYELQRQIRIEAVSMNLKGKFETYERYVDMSNAIAKKIFMFRRKRSGEWNVSVANLDDRLTALEYVYSLLSNNVNNISLYFPGTTIPSQWASCLNQLTECSMNYVAQKALNITLDTTISGQNRFDLVMYNVLNLQDSLIKYIPVFVEATQKEIDKYDKQYHLVR